MSEYEKTKAAYKSLWWKPYDPESGKHKPVVIDWRVRDIGKELRALERLRNRMYNAAKKENKQVTL